MIAIVIAIKAEAEIGYLSPMTSSSRSGLLLLVAAAALLAACGGRSQLHEGGGAGAAGGGSGPTTSSASASGGGGSGGAGGHGDVGGSGGMLGGCVVDGPPIGLAGTDGYVTSNPTFVLPVQIDGLTLVSAWRAAEDPTPTPTELRHTSFKPWDAWPADATLGPSYLAEYGGAQEFQAAPALTDFSLVFAGSPPASGLTYASGFIPGSGSLGAATAIGSGEERPCFLERGTEPHVKLLGFSSSTAGLQSFNVLRFNDPFTSPAITANLGCSLAPIVAGAAAFGEDFLVAYASGSNFDDAACASGTGIITSQRLFTARVSNQGKVALAQEILAGGSGATIASVKVIPRLDGAWLTWAETGSDGLQIVRLDPTGHVAAGPFTVPFFGNADSFSATSLGDRLALAWTFSPTDVSPSVQVRVVDPQGNITAQASLIVSSIAPGRTAVLGSPSEKALLLAWARFSQVGPEIQLARLACALP